MPVPMPVPSGPSGRRWLASACLVLAFASASSRVHADVSDIALLGEQANLMAGSVTASTQGGPSMWYNPSRLSFAGDHKFVVSVSGAGVAVRVYRAPEFIRSHGQTSPGKTSEFLALPRAT